MKKKLRLVENKVNTLDRKISTKENIVSKIEEIREFIKEMHYRYQCYYKIEVKGWKYGYNRKGLNLHYYLTHTEEEWKKTKTQILQETRELVEQIYGSENIDFQ